MRPLSFTKNLGLRKAFNAIRRGYKAGISERTFRELCGIGDSSLVITEFLLGTRIVDDEECILRDAVVDQTLSQHYSKLTARLYLFAINLNMPGERIKEEHKKPAEMQNSLAREFLYVGDRFEATRFEKDRVQEFVRHLADLSPDALRKWVTNYMFMVEQCEFVPTPDGRLETFPDAWGALGLRLFFERVAATYPAPDVNALVSIARAKEIHKLIGASSS